MESYEVIIIGAGPAGLSCAQKLSEAGKKVLLLEKNKVIGPKVCAGGLTGKDLDHFGLPENILDYKFSRGAVSTPLQKSIVSLERPFAYTVDRKNLGQWQLEKIKKTGVAVHASAVVTEVGKDHVIINNSEKVGFEYLVGADGSSSIVRSFLGLKIRDLITAIQFIVPGEKYKNFEVFFDPRLFSFGYAWIFPHKGYASIGCGCDYRLLSAKKLRERFDKWLENNKIDVSGGQFQAHPINVDFQGYKFGNIFLAGDAAGLASCLTGEGIYQAMVSGEEVAAMIMDPGYVPVRLNKIIAKNRTYHRIYKILEHSGYFLRFEFELIAFFLKIKIFQKKIIDFLI